jgi:TATA-box binding protein (TBP) (component of TFIID and TFIIIB)
VIVKAGKHKCINIKFFNNGRITLTGSKEDDDGLRACQVMLEEMKKEKSIFMDMSEEDIEKLEIRDYEVTMINSGFCLNFKVDLNSFLNGIQRDYPMIFTKFNPEKYRGLIIGYFWNQEKGKNQDGICRCGEERCKGKGKGERIGECKKVTISIFKSGETIITGARTMTQIRKAHEFFLNLVKEYFKTIMKVSVMDYMEKPNDEIDFDEMEKYIQEEEKKITKKGKKPMKA